jgi:hypothetical protein
MRADSVSRDARMVHAQAFDDLALGLGLAQLVARAARDDVAAVLDEDLEGLLQIEDGGTTAHDGEVDDAERRLEVREAIQLVDDDLRDDVFLELDHEAHAVAIGLVAALRDAFDLLLAHQLADARVNLRLVLLVGDLGDDDLLLVATARGLLDLHAGAHDDVAASGALGRLDAAAAEDEVVDRALRVADQVHRRVDHLAEVVRRYVGRHADGDAARAVDEQVRDARRQDRGLDLRVVEVRDEVDALLVDVAEQLDRELREARLGVAVGCGGVAVDGAVVALAVDERVAHREVLGETDHRVVDARVTVRVIVAEHVTDDGGALAVRGGGQEPLLVRGVQDAPVDGLQAVTRVGDGAPHDDAHRVIEVARAHLVLDRDRDPLAVSRAHRRAVSGGRRRGRRGRICRRIHVRHRCRDLVRPALRGQRKRASKTV